MRKDVFVIKYFVWKCTIRSTPAGRWLLLTNFWNINSYFTHEWTELFQQILAKCGISQTLKTFHIYQTCDFCRPVLHIYMWRNPKANLFCNYIKINCRSSSNEWTRGVNRWESDFPEHCARPCRILHLVLQPVSSKALSLFTTSCLLWSYLRATLQPRASWSWISAYNPSQKLIVLWHPAGLFSPRNLRPQFPELSLDVPLAPLQPRPLDIKYLFASISSTWGHIFLL